MKIFMSYFFSADIRIRAAVLLALFIVFFWWILGKVIIRIASLFPYLLRTVFKRVYLLIEMPVCWLHERVGAFFLKIDNGLAVGGRKIDTFLERWYLCWHNPESHQIFLSILIYCALLIWICIPYHPDEPNVRSVSGQEKYLKWENKLTNWLERNKLYEAQIEDTMVYDEPEQAEEEKIRTDIVMKVITQKDPLSIRNIPSTENCEVLERVEKENIVIWKGDMAFGNGSNGSIEPWVKVETLEGNIGWARLVYLCPLNEEDFELELQISSIHGL